MSYPLNRLSRGFAFFVILIACGLQLRAQDSPSSFVPVTDTMLENPDPAD